jgi:hypothetical protein
MPKPMATPQALQEQRRDNEENQHDQRTLSSQRFHLIVMCGRERCWLYLLDVEPEN